MSTPPDPFENTGTRKGQFAVRVTVVVMGFLLAIYVIGNLWHLHDVRQEQAESTATNTP